MSANDGLSEPSSHRQPTIRSFVRREGRITAGQRRALEVLWPRYGIPARPLLLDLDALFGRSAPRVLEIGFGNGDTLATLAERHPERDFLGVEIYRPGVGRLLARAAQLGLSNLKVGSDDAVELLRSRIPDRSLSQALIFFPDPWPKQRHHKRRLVQPGFVRLLTAKLHPGGTLHLATDWESYALQMLEVLQASPEIRNLAPEGGFAPRPPSRPVTKFERRGRRLGHGVWDLLFERIRNHPPPPRASSPRS